MMGDSESSIRKRELFDLLLQEEGLGVEATSKITRRRSAGPFVPLSFTQQQMWFLDQLQPRNSSYNVPVAVRLRGPLNGVALERSLNEVVRRHEILRTTFIAIDGTPVQVIAPALTLPVPVVDLRWVSGNERESLARQMADEEAHRPFDLANGPLLRALLLALVDQEHVFQLTLQHIVIDGWSIRVLFQELFSLYDAFSSGKLSPLSELPFQYADFVHWQRERLQGEILEEQLSYWKQQLHGIPELLELPTDRPRPPVQSFRGMGQSMVLSKDLTEQLKGLSRREGATLFMTLLAVFNALLSRLTGQADIVVGSPIAGRSRGEFEGLIGLFMNTLVLRTDLSDNPSFCELLRRVREVTLQAYDHQEVPFEKLMGELQLKRSLSRNTLFQVMFAFHTDRVRQNYKPLGLTVSSFPIRTGMAKFDLYVSIRERIDDLDCYFAYNTDLFDGATIQRMARHFTTLLEGIVTSPRERVSALPLLSRGERQQLLAGWNETKRDYPKEKCMHELFEAQVERAPESVAVVFEGQQLTYGELNRRANQLAHYLQKRGVGPEVAVGLYLERSVDTIIALLAILKAGGAYVPLDPNQPLERLAFMLEDSRASVLLTRRDLLEQWSVPSIENPKALPSTVEGSKVENRKVIYLDCEREVIARESQKNPQVDVTAENRAYVIYTSGSTGRPKGVEISHGSLVNFILSTCDVLAVSDRDRILQFASISFDTAVEEIFPCLNRGATLVLRTDSMLESASIFWQKCRDWQITVLDLPTVYWHELTEELVSELTLPDALRLVIIGGERAVPERFTQWQKLVGDHVRLLNTYGPTEATVVATVWEPSGTAPKNELIRGIPIGRPISNVQTYILDKYLEPVPIGVPGELYIGGAGLARGYLNRPELTGDKFIPNPFSDEPGERLYRTGDLARYLSDGNIEFLGRLDDQVKVRGFRMELSEIEAVLAEHPDVRQAAVHLWQVEANDVRIVACCVPAKAGVLAPISLRKHLRARLPEYMVPQYFLPMEQIPLMPNGKIDRSKLPVPVVTESPIGQHEAPSDPIETAIAEIWTNLIGPARPIGRADKFFEMGGHSLLALQALRQIENKLGVRLDLRVLFQESLIDIAMRCRSERIAAGLGQSGAASPLVFALE